MQHRFFAIPAVGGESAADELNRFVGSTTVATVERHLVMDGVRSFWAVCVVVAQPPAIRGHVAAGKRSSVDYKEVLAAEDFAVFARLREVRKNLAEQAGVPVYGVFTNEQLAEIVTSRVETANALGAVKGVGPSRVQRFGAAILEAAREARASSSEQADAPAVG